MINQYDYHYKVYIDKCLALVSTMIIKSTKDARDMSNELFYRTLHRYDENDPSSWIYYKHISGEYHVTDEPIYVISVDTTERIIFNNRRESCRNFRRASISRFPFKKIQYNYWEFR